MTLRSGRQGVEPGILAGASGPDILALIGRHAAQRPDAVAVRHLRPGRPPTSLTWTELLREATRARAAFSAVLEPGQIVPAYLGKSCRTVGLMAGVIAAGGVYAGLNAKYRLPQVQQVLRSCAGRIAVVDGAGLAVLRPAFGTDGGLGQTRWWLSELPSGGSAGVVAESLLADGAIERFPDPAVVSGPGPMSALRATPSSSALARQEDSARAAICLFTSGSTGAPKGVLVSWDDLLARAEGECLLYGISPSDVLLNLLPFSFDVGLNQLLCCLVSGATLVMLDSWMPVDILNALAAQAITGVSGVPSIWQSLLRSGLRLERDGRHAPLRYLTVSGGDLPAALLQPLAEFAADVAIFKTYGQTESFRSTALRPEEFRGRPGSVGRPVKGARVYVLRPDGSQAGPREVGEVIHTGAGTMLGYLDPAASVAKLRPNPFHGPDDQAALAVYTGDDGFLDDEGYLHLAGRRDDLVKIHGNRVHLSEVAAEAARVPGVLAAEAIAVELAHAELALVLFVIGSDRTADPDPARLAAELLHRLPSYMLPRHVAVRHAFPLTVNGKVDRPELRREAATLIGKVRA
jgi:acyl-CoA synthetase (AMP-forming)/AMP-acid ligase II